MAITKTNLYNADKTVAAENLYTYLMDVAYPKYFNGISIDAESNEIVCTVDSTPFLKISHLSDDSKINFTVTTKNGTTTTVNFNSTSDRFEYAYSCENGIIFTSTDTDPKSSFGICKTNVGDTVTIFPYTGTNMSSTSYACALNSNACLVAISVCDDTLYAFTTAKIFKSTVRITSLAPIPTNCIDGRYCKDVFYMPFCENTSIGVLTINGVKYMSNGFWCVKDE